VFADGRIQVIGVHIEALFQAKRDRAASTGSDSSAESSDSSVKHDTASKGHLSILLTYHGADVYNNFVQSQAAHIFAAKQARRLRLLSAQLYD
jgi:hypothetical protein